MKKYILGAAALAVALIGFGSLAAPTTYANPSKIWVVNDNVLQAMESGSASAPCGAVFGSCDPTTAAGRAKFSATLDAVQTASAGQVAITGGIPVAGDTLIFVQTDGSNTAVALNGRGLTCDEIAPNANAAVCGATPVTDAPDATDHFVVYTVDDTGTHAVGDTLVVTATQDAVPLDSTSLTIVGQAHDFQLTAVLNKTTIQEAAPSCALTDSISNPTRAGVLGTYTDINGTALVGYNLLGSWTSSSVSTMTVSAPASISLLLPDGKTIAAYNVVCGVAAGSATLTAKTNAPEVLGTGVVTRTLAFTVTGVPASIALTASPATIACDGTATSTVTAKVTDSAGNDVVDNTPVTFNVAALGTANPIQAKTVAGSASSTITPLSGGVAGVTVIVTAGDVQSSIRVDCLLPTPTVPPVPVATATPPGGITPPVTGTGGYLGQDGSAGFPMWTLIALALGSVALVAGRMVTRRAGK